MAENIAANDDNGSPSQYAVAAESILMAACGGNDAQPLLARGSQPANSWRGGVARRLRWRLARRNGGGSIK